MPRRRGIGRKFKKSRLTVTEEPIPEVEEQPEEGVEEEEPELDDEVIEVIEEPTSTVMDTVIEKLIDVGCMAQPRRRTCRAPYHLRTRPHFAQCC